MAPQLQRATGPFETRFTDAPFSASGLTRVALLSGAELVVSVGGDGTLNEVVNGFFGTDGLVNANAALGVLMVGTGGDFRKTLGLPRDLADQVARLSEGGIRALDVGRLRLIDPQGVESRRYFHNIASFGLSGATDHAVNSLKYAKLLGGRLAFQWGMLKAMLRYRNRPVRIQIDDHFDEIISASTVAVCNGQYFGGGMRVAPHALPDDGLFDIVIVGDIGRLQLLRRVSSVYEGSHVFLDKVSVIRGRRLVASPVDTADEILIDADGEVAGRLPAIFEILPGALRVRA